MKFSCEKALLSNAVLLTARAASPKSTVPAMEGILIEAIDILRLTGYNLKTGIQATVPADVVEEGTLVLSARLFVDIIRKLPDDIVTISTNNMTVNISCGQSVYNIQGTDPSEFPELPSVDWKNSLTLSQNALRSVIDETLYAIGSDETKPILTGSYFEADGDTLTVVSVDGYRLALRQETLAEKRGDDTFSFVVPGVALTEVEKMCGAGGDITIIQGSQHVMFRTDDFLLVSRRLEGQFLDFRRAIPRDNPIRILVRTQDLLSSIERVSLIISDRLKNPLQLVFGDGVVSISCRTSLGDATDSCVTEGNGEGLEIGFNNRYLMEALRAAPADKLQLELSTSVAPCVIRAAEGEDNFISMVLPVRLKRD